MAAIGTTYVLPAIGFCATDVQAGSIAASVQSVVFGAIIPAGGTFAALQSLGATGALECPFGAATPPIGIIVGGGTYLIGRALV